MIDLTEMTVPEQLEAAATAIEDAAALCQAVRANIPPELIVAGLGNPQSELAMSANVHLGTIAAAIRSVIPANQTLSPMPAMAVALGENPGDGAI